MLGLGRNSTSIVLFMFDSTAKARVAKVSAWLLLVLGNLSIYAELKLLNSFMYASIFWFLATYSPVSWFATNWESKLMTRFCTSRILAFFRSTIKALYLASLFEAVKPNWTAYSMMVPSGDLSIMPTLEPSLVDDSSISKVQVYFRNSSGHLANRFRFWFCRTSTLSMSINMPSCPPVGAVGGTASTTVARRLIDKNLLDFNFLRPCGLGPNSTMGLINGLAPFSCLEFWPPQYLCLVGTFLYPYITHFLVHIHL